MSLKSSWTRIRYLFAVAVVAGTIGAVTNFVGCGTSSTYATTDPYLYTVYYPADVAYSTVYWADDWYYPSLYAIYTPSSPNPVTTGTAGSNGVAPTGGMGGTIVSTGGAGGSTVVTDGGVTTGGVLTTAGDAIRALARGESVCPGAITVSPKTAPPACTGGTMRAGATIVFNACQTPGGATLDGMIDVSSTRSANSATCTTATVISLSHTTTITNLSYTNAAGQRLIIPSQTGMGSTRYTFGQTPATVALSFTGQLQTYRSAGNSITSDHNYTGNLTFSFGGSNMGYTVDGGVTVMDNRAPGSGSTVTVTGLKRVSTCCRPIGGTIGLSQVGPTGPGTHVWSFGPACGESTIDGTGATLPACI
jgi:hypothetical protein